MNVTPIGKSFNKHKVGDVFSLPDKAARIFISRGQLRQVTQTTPLKSESAVEISPRTGLPKREYKRRDMRAES